MDVDEVHFYLEADLKSKWSYKGKQPSFVETTSPGRAKLSFYGAVVPEKGKIILMETSTFNGKQSAQFLEKIRGEFPGRRIDLVWDNGPHHKGEEVEKAVKKFNIRLVPLPAYSPELSKIEPLWRWTKEKVTYNYCHDKKAVLRQDIFAAIEQIKSSPVEMQKRLKRDTSQIRDLLKEEESKSQHP